MIMCEPRCGRLRSYFAVRPYDLSTLWYSFFVWLDSKLARQQLCEAPAVSAFARTSTLDGGRVSTLLQGEWNTKQIPPTFRPSDKAHTQGVLALYCDGQTAVEYPVHRLKPKLSWRFV